MKQNHYSAMRPGSLLALFLLLVLGPAAGTVAAVEVTVDNVEAPAGGEVEVPVRVRGATGLEGLQFVLTFDPNAVECVEVVAGPIACGEPWQVAHSILPCPLESLKSLPGSS